MPDTTALIEALERAEGPSRFWSKVRVGDEGECWPWIASTSPKGYGQFSVGGRAAGTYRMIKAHRFAYEAKRGPIPEGLHIDHLCRNRACCNPAHLEVVTVAENNRRAAAAHVACQRGHQFTPENTITTSKGRRECRQCRLDRKRMYRIAALRAKGAQS